MPTNHSKAFISVPLYTHSLSLSLSFSGSLEEFDDPITDLHYRLFTNIIRRPADKENWIFVASKVRRGKRNLYLHGFIMWINIYEITNFLIKNGMYMHKLIMYLVI